MSFNKIIVVGHLGRDPELRYTPQGDAVCDFSMATSERRRDKAGEYQAITTWFRVTLWRKQAENAAKYLAKGRQVYIEGRLRVEDWTDRDGNNRYTLEVQGTDMQFIDSAGSRGEGHQRDEAGEAEFAGPATTSGSEQGGAGFSRPASSDDDIPF
ncbi:MAG: single-stranded DNA-binding protein [Pyrinomonadaceae bacterium]